MARTLFGLILLFYILNQSVLAQKNLNVCVSISPPFVTKADDNWSGSDIKIWQEIAAEQNLKYTYKEKPIHDLVKVLQNGECDLFISALTVTIEREEEIDFSHPYFKAGLGIATLSANKPLLIKVFEQIFSWKFFAAIMSLVILLLTVGVFVWYFERNENDEEFGNGIINGLGSAFWWSAVTMTTVGYGDKSPRTSGGRFVALIWMFTSVVVISSFTASIASVITLSSIEGQITNIDDLKTMQSGTIRGSSSESELQKRGLSYRIFPSLESAFKALRNKEVSAVVYDRPLLKYYNSQLPEDQRFFILEQSFAKQNYAIAFPQKSELIETVNLGLLKTTSLDESDLKESP